MSDKKKKKKSASKITPKSADRGGSHVVVNVAEQAKSSNAHTFQSDKSGGNGYLLPSLAEGNVDGGFVDENPQASSEISRPARTKAPNKMLNEEMNAEKAVHAKRQRAGHIGELRKRRNYLQELITSPEARVNEVEDRHTYKVLVLAQKIIMISNKAVYKETRLPSHLVSCKQLCLISLLFFGPELQYFICVWLEMKLPTSLAQNLSKEVNKSVTRNRASGCATKIFPC